jgi:GTP-binding protein HflX
VILHVRDASHTDWEAQAHDVAAILDELGLKGEAEGRIIEVWNKIDALDSDRLEALRLVARGFDPARRPELVSAVTGAGLEALLTRIETVLAANRVTLEVNLAPEDGQGLAWLHAHAEVLERRTRKDGGVRLSVRVAPERLEEVQNRFALSMRRVSED